MSIPAKDMLPPGQVDRLMAKRDFGPRQRQRDGGTWSFLTWAFFISQVLAAEQFMGTSAAAATDEATGGGDNGLADADAGSSPNMPAAISRSSVDTNLSSGQEQVYVVDLVPQALDTASNLSSFTDKGRGHGQAQDEPSGASVTSGARQFADSSGSSGGRSPCHCDNGAETDFGRIIDFGPITSPGALLPGLGDTLSDIIDGAVQPIDGAVDSLVDALGTTISSTLASVNNLFEDILGNTVAPLTGTVGELLDALDDAVADAARPLTHAVDAVGETLTSAPIVSGLAGGLGGLFGDGRAEGEHSVGSTELHGVVAPPGEIVFKVLPVVGDLGADNLFSGGRYTDYNLALRAVPHDGSTAKHGDGAAGSSTLLDTYLLADTADQHVGGQPDRGVVLPSVLEEMSLRGLGDGISL